MKANAVRIQGRTFLPRIAARLTRPPGGWARGAFLLLFLLAPVAAAAGASSPPARGEGQGGSAVAPPQSPRELGEEGADEVALAPSGAADPADAPKAAASSPNSMNMEFRDADLPAVLRAICQGAGLDFVLEPKVQGKVTAKLRNTSWQSALDIVLKSHGLSATRQGNTLLISVAAPAEATAASPHRVRITPRPGDKLDLDAGGADLREAVRELAAAARLNIVVSKDVAGSVTASLHDLRPEEILVALADSCGASIAEKGHTIVVAPRPLAPAAPAAGPATPGSPAKAASLVQVKRLADGKLDIHAARADARELLTQLAAASGLNIVAAPALSGTISLDLTAISPQDALAAIAAQSHLTFRPVGSVLYAAPAPPAIQTEAFRLRHAKAEEVGKVITGCLDGAKVAVEPTNNLLIVSASPDTLAAVRAVIERVETPPIQVTIEARILETNLTGDEWLGIEWSDSFTIHAATPEIPFSFPVSKNATSNFLPSYDPASSLSNGDKVVPFADPGIFKFGILSSSGLNLILHSLQKDSITRMLANPTVTTIENREANIKFVTKYPIAQYQVSSETGLLTVSGFEYKEFGTTLTVTPRVSDGHVILDVHPEVSRPAGTTAFQGATLPIIESQETQTQVRIKDGDTLVIAGLIREDGEKSNTGVPFFSRLPLIGTLFRSKRDKLDSRRNLIIFITPHIVGDADFTRAADLRKKRTEPLPDPEGAPR